MNDLDNILKSAVLARATDLHICENIPPRMRVDNALAEMSVFPIMNPSQVLGFILEKLPASQKAVVSKKLEEGKDADCAFDCPGQARARVNIYRSENGMSFAFRIIPNARLTAEQIGLTHSIMNICNFKSGLFIVTGANGSGKTSTLAALIDAINASRKVHVLTIEDPIEYKFQSKVALISQREVSTHSPSFYEALRSSVRENPDVIVLGEMRDLETTRTAIELAETGHLVFATLHTRTATSTIDRLIGQFPAAEQPQIRLMISDNMIGVLAQAILVKKAGGLVAAFEFLRCTPAVRNLIREQKVSQIYSVIQTSQQLGMTTMEDSMLKLVANSVVTPQEAVSKSHSPTQMVARMLESPLISKADLAKLA